MLKALLTKFQQSKITPDIANCFLGDKITLREMVLFEKDTQIVYGNVQVKGAKPPANNQHLLVRHGKELL